MHCTSLLSIFVNDAKIGFIQDSSKNVNKKHSLDNMDAWLNDWQLKLTAEKCSVRIG